jgi:hypothetical protein
MPAFCHHIYCRNCRRTHRIAKRFTDGITLPATNLALLIGVAAALVTLPACTEAPSWQTLLTAKIRQQYPSYNVQPQPDGSVVVRRPGQADAPVDVKAIGEFCRRGPKDCNYATDQMLLELGAVKK